jgi:hypothetical protein
MSDAEHIHVRGEGGTIFRLALPLHESISDRLARGHLVRVTEDGEPWTGDTAPSVPAPPSERPAQAAPKAEWVGWAVAQGALPDDAEAATKADLIEQYGKGDV